MEENSFKSGKNQTQHYNQVDTGAFNKSVCQKIKRKQFEIKDIEWKNRSNKNRIHEDQ